MKIVALTSCPTGVAHTYMAAEALKKTALVMGHSMNVETQGASGARDVLTEEAIAAADVVILATDIRVDTSRFAGKRTIEVPVSEAIRETKAVIEKAVALVPANEMAAAAPIPIPVPVSDVAATTSTGSKRIVAITACPTGIAHTFMAAEALQKAAKALGYEIKVETQGSVGSQNKLTPEDIAAADAVVVAAETKVDTAPFAGKRLFMTSTKHAMHNGREVIETALKQPVEAAGGTDLASSVEAAKAARSKARTGPYKHLMTGVSYMLPIVIAGGLAIALAFAFGGIYAGDQKGT
ncbi:MAG TPA: PTS fructose-like transporter subunit IIB, partial [Candidatus Saccharimonadia bacterium]|nr:PTS fructose-like transporter subunit IIB [Candidatus Saccharimonadia bacterium]